MPRQRYTTEQINNKVRELNWLKKLALAADLPQEDAMVKIEQEVKDKNECCTNSSLGARTPRTIALNQRILKPDSQTGS